MDRMSSEQALHIAMIKVLMGIRYKLNSIDKDIDELIKIIAKQYNLDVVIEEPGYLK
jgi:hypothetical protein